MKVALFFTFGTSLSDWAKSGLLDREIALYKKLINKGVDIIFITYGGPEDYEHQPKLGSIKIIPFYTKINKPKSMVMAYVYSILLPYILKEKLKEVSIFKTNQIWGSWTAIIAKFLFNKPLVVRCGFEKYYNLTRSRIFNLKIFIWRIVTWSISFFAYHSADRIILTSHLAKKFIKKRFRVNQKKVDVFYNFIDINIFRPMVVSQYDDRVLFIGRLNKVKNISSIIDAISKTKYQLDIIGRGELKNELYDYISKNNIAYGLRVWLRAYGQTPMKHSFAYDLCIWMSV